MKVTVTAEHIRYGQAYEASACPIALAIFDIPGTRSASVGSGITWTRRPDPHDCTTWSRVFVQTPEVAVDFIRRFDHGEPVKPFSFWLDVGDGAEPFVAPEPASEAVPA